jgi:opacity protein-like surface antigen
VYKILQLVILVAALGTVAWAQKAEIALTAGVYHPVNNGYSSSNAFAIEGNVAGRIFSVPFVSIYVEVPVAGTLNTTVPAAALTNAGTYSSIFVAPGLRLKLAPSFPLSPYIAAGGGLAHFNRSASETPSGASSSINKALFDIGGGLDLKIAPFLSVRAEVRDFYSGSPELTLNQVTGTFNQRQHNILGTAGLVLRF